MKNLTKHLLIFLVFFGIMIIIPGAIRKSYQKKAVIIEFPTIQKMTAEERNVQKYLFDGDKLVRVYITKDNIKTYAIYSVYEQLRNPGLKPGNTVSVNNFLNGGEYLIEK